MGSEARDIDGKLASGPPGCPPNMPGALKDFPALDRRNASQQVADRLCTAITLGEFLPGHRLPPERELAEMLDIGRPTVREAFGRLEGLGLVEIRRGRTGGAWVLPFEWPRVQAAVRRTLLPAWAEFEVLFDFRTLVERLVAETAAERHTDDDRTIVRAALAAYEAAGDSREASRAADERLHRAIAKATQNRYLAGLSMELRLKVSLGFQSEPYTPALRERALEQHPLLVAAVLERRAEDAARLAAEHFGLTETMYRELFARALDERSRERDA